MWTPVTALALFQVWTLGWAKAQLLGGEGRLLGSVVSCDGKPLNALSDWSDKGDVCRESPRDHTDPVIYLLLVSGEKAAQLSA